MLPYPSLRQGLVGAWCPSLGATGLTLLDRSARGNHGTLTNMDSQDNWRASGGGLAIRTDGVDDWVSAAANVMPLGSQPRTLSCWINKPNNTTYGVMIDSGTVSAMNRCMFLVVGAGGYSTLVNQSVAVEFNTTTAGTSTTIPLNQWVHLAATVTGTMGATRIFIDGLAAAMNFRGPQANAVNTTNAAMGLFGKGTSSSYGEALYDDLRIYNRVLTLAEIRLLASRRGIGLSSVGPRLPPLTQLYPITTPPNRIWSNQSGVWTPGSVRANESGAWRNGDVKVNDGGVWITARYHPEAEDWKSRAEAAGGTVSETTLSAVSDFCTAINAAGIRDRMYRLNLFCGGNLAACLTPLYRGPTADGGYGNLYDTNVNFVAGDYQETGASGGLKGDGTNKHLNTGYPANTLAASNTHLGVGVTSDDTLAGTTRTAIGSYNGSANSLEIGLRNATSPSVFFSRFATSTDRMGDNSGAYSLLAKGDLIAAWPQFYRNGVAAGSPATTSQNYPLSHSVAVFANNQANTSVISHTDARLAWYSIGATMTAAQASAFSAAIAAFRTALGRA